MKKIVILLVMTLMLVCALFLDRRKNRSYIQKENI